jgi:hypothetical protein
MSSKIRKRKNYDCLSHDQKYRNKELIRLHLIELHKILLSMSLTFGKVIKFFPLDEANQENREALIEDFNFKINEKSYFDSCDIKRIFRFKEEHNISDHIYMSMRSRLFPDIPSIYKIKQLRTFLNSKFEYHFNSVGIFLNVYQKLTYILGQVIEQLSISRDELIFIKFCGDGTLIGRNLKIFNFGFSCLNEKYYCKTNKGHYSLGIFEITNENYDELKTALKELFEQINCISHIEFKGEKYLIEKKLGGDLKFLANVMGLQNANSNYPCVWCTSHKRDFLASDFNLRTLDKAHKCCKKREIDEKKGYAREPIAIGFSFDKCVVDLLHLFLRITDVLEEKLIVKLRTIDAIHIRPSESNDIEKQPMIKRYIEYLSNEIGISRVYHIKENSISIRSLVGDEKLKLFESIDIEKLFPQEVLKESIHINLVILIFYF